jgi:hypothetical protein
VLPLEDEPSTLVARYLFPTERYRGEWKRHWIHLTNHLLIGVAATFVSATSRLSSQAAVTGSGCRGGDLGRDHGLDRVDGR